MPAVQLPAPVALARPVDTLNPPGVREPVWEPKWDGYRVLVGRGRIWSRRAVNLTRYFPDLVPVLAARLPDDVVLDGELIAWDTDAGRLDFASLQQRLTAGTRLRTVAARRPAQLVAFDILATGDADARARPLQKRRKLLEQTLLGLGSPIVVCQQTDDPARAQEWFETLTAGGIEGVVVKDATSSYPTTEGQRVWWKCKARADLDMLAVGFTGSATAPTALVLAFPGDVDRDGAPVTAGSTTVLNRAAQRAVVPLLRPTGESFSRVFAWGQTDPSSVTVIEPFAVEVSADASAEHGTLRHAARLLRTRPDLDVSDLTA